MPDIDKLQQQRADLMRRANEIVDGASSEQRRTTNSEAQELDQVLGEAADVLDQMRSLNPQAKTEASD